MGPITSTSEFGFDSSSSVDFGNEISVEHDSQYITDSTVKETPTVTDETPTNVSDAYVKGDNINIIVSPFL